MKDTMKIVFFGAGAIGQSVGGWIAPHHHNLYFLDRGDVARTMKERGVELYQQGSDKREQVRLRVMDDVSGLRDADVIVLGVKNYSLDGVCDVIRKHAGDRPVIIGMQNGVENQKILPKYFSKVIYCVIGYNAWFDKPGVLGYQKKGPLVLGTVNNELMREMHDIAALFNRGVETIVVDHLQDAAHSKLIINLTNSLTTLIGHGFREVSNIGDFQKILTNMLYEGTRIVKAAGYRECKIGGMPSWTLMKLGATLPQFITRPLFRKNAAKMVMSSMAQDIIQRGGHDSELESINGYILELARKTGLSAPFNRAVYDLCKREFTKQSFTPIDVHDVFDEVMKYQEKRH